MCRVTSSKSSEVVAATDSSMQRANFFQLALGLFEEPCIVDSDRRQVRQQGQDARFVGGEGVLR